MSGGRGYLHLNNNRNDRRGYNNNGYNNNDRGRGFRQNRYNNNNNNNNQNTLPDEALPPMTYESEPDKQNRVKIKWTSGRGVTARTASEKVAARINGDVIDTNNRLNKVVTETTKRILGRNTYDNQIEYLKNTKKQRKMSADEWMHRIQMPNIPLKMKYHCRTSGAGFVYR